jgi:hypothetical protein
MISYKPEYSKEYGHPFDLRGKSGRERAVNAAMEEAEANGLLFFEAVPHNHDSGITITCRGGYRRSLGGRFYVDTEYGDDGNVTHTLTVYGDGNAFIDQKQSKPNQSLNSFLFQLENAKAERRKAANMPRREARGYGHRFDLRTIAGRKRAINAAANEAKANGLKLHETVLHNHDSGITVTSLGKGRKIRGGRFYVATEYCEGGNVIHTLNVYSEGNAHILSRQSKPNQSLKSFLKSLGR